MVAVVVEPAAILDRRRDPKSGEPEIANVVELRDEAFEVAPPVRVTGPPFGVERDAVAAVEIVRRVAIVEACRDHEVNGFFAKVSEPRHVARLRGRWR